MTHGGGTKQKPRGTVPAKCTHFLTCATPWRGMLGPDTAGHTLGCAMGTNPRMVRFVWVMLGKQPQHHSGCTQVSFSLYACSMRAGGVAVLCSTDILRAHTVGGCSILELHVGTSRQLRCCSWERGSWRVVTYFCIHQPRNDTCPVLSQPVGQNHMPHPTEI